MNIHWGEGETLVNFNTNEWFSNTILIIIAINSEKNISEKYNKMSECIKEFNKTNTDNTGWLSKRRNIIILLEFMNNYQHFRHKQTLQKYLKVYLSGPWEFAHM